MRTPWIAVFFVFAACSSGKEVSPPHPIRYKLQSLPYMQATRGLPVSGDTTLKIDSTLVGVTDWTTAKGLARFDCTVCRVGNDLARLEVRNLADTGGGLPFGHLDFAASSLTVTFVPGSMQLAAELHSSDVELHARVAGRVAKVLGDTSITGCVQFRATEALRQRDAQTYAVMMSTGALTDREGWSNIAIEGTIANPRMIGRTCTMPSAARST